MKVDKERYHRFDCQPSNQLRLVAPKIEVALKLNQLTLASFVVAIWRLARYARGFVNQHQNYQHEQHEFK